MITTTDDIVKRAQLAAGMHDGPFTPTQWMYWATLENIALSIFLARTGWAKNVKTQTITVSGSEAGAFVLTQNPLAIVAIHQIKSDGRVRQVRVNNEVDFLHQLVSGTKEHGDPAEYRVIWDQDNDRYQVNFYPQPDAGMQFLVSYIPHPLQLVIGTPGAGQANSVSYPLGFEEYIVIKLAIRAKNAAEEDASSLMQEFASIQSVIEQAAWDEVFAAAKVRNVDQVERGWSKGLVYPPNTEWWFA